jgi:excisionase family DNA binding protein
MVLKAEREEERLWESVMLFSKDDRESATAILKQVVQNTLYEVGPYTKTAPLVMKAHIVKLDKQLLVSLRTIQQKLKKTFSQKVVQDIQVQFLQKQNELLIEYISTFSEMMKEDEVELFKRKILSTMFTEQMEKINFYERIASLVEKLEHQKMEVGIMSEKSYYTPREAAKKLGVSDQTVRRMCQAGRFKGAYQTDGGHWKIPKDNFITTDEQDERIEKMFNKLDKKNKEAGDVDEFEL